MISHLTETDGTSWRIVGVFVINEYINFLMFFHEVNIA